MSQEWFKVCIYFKNNTQSVYYIDKDQLATFEKDLIDYMKNSYEPEKTTGAYSVHSVDRDGSMEDTTRRLVVSFADIHHIG